MRKMLLPLVAKIGILPLMTLLFRRFFGVFICCLLVNSGCITTPSYPQHQGYRYVSTTPKTAQQVRQRITPTQQNVIEQVAYTAESATPQEPKQLRITVGQQSQASAELHQPWNLSEFPVRSSESGSPYRLVSDSQPIAPKTPPPAGGLQHLLTIKTDSTKTTSVKTSSTVSPSQSVPILGIGQKFLDEFRPSNRRKWSQNHAVLQTAEFNDNLVTIRNVRYSRYDSAESYTTQYYDATLNLDDVRTIDLIVVPFQGLARLAHVESSFGFADGRQLGLSIEARYEENEKYDPLAASMRQFELVYVLADERDMIRLATDVNKNNVYIYRLKFEPNEVRAMFVDALQRANKLAVKPEFYHPLTNSCVTNLIAHINKGAPKAVPREYRTLMPGLLDNYMYDLKLVATSAKTFKEAKEMAKVNWLVERYGDLEYFSAGIRQNMY